MPRAPFQIGDHAVEPGTRRTVDLPVSVLSDHTPVTMSVHVVHGKRPGPTLFISAAVHGDEIIGVEIARRVLGASQLDTLKGTLLVVPIVNTFGFLNHSRYMPDRRDLNRCFPGSAAGSLAGRLAHLFMTEIVARSDIGIDLHSAAIHRTNLPQIRVSASSPDTLQLAQSFGAPLVIRAKLREGSLRAAARDTGVDILLYEAGEALRFDEMSARIGASGCLRVMQALGMIAKKGLGRRADRPVTVKESSWVRAPAGGLLRLFRESGETVDEGQTLATVSDPFGTTDTDLTAPFAGVIIGRATMPIVNEGDAVYHLASVPVTDSEDRLTQLAADLEADPMFDEDEIL
ncbi:Succinylglutamate desuccinylase / Aspartoacylase family protein [Rhodobacteraceae bacterium THAF1]|uniref:succinylglutamate desuccinylase/aspartoacylase family protein n=1 Tax=Palleronia sp. THAF1 TaxID=2587842 RepID=UPI000F3DC08A|nr:succinylglutamate desuccinylase/aspartoacylase family protein [Palleronia sp. THAF1]QFU09522.1 Succinylglutamate desuccinylase / Aspartoacylase family protein [Palleronia sp. THAF1]VDC21797.1 Succinylglutamate desuccinylase / Aspartoacylase family protein [Rhodobacteraceae bacterium THAF1]